MCSSDLGDTVNSASRMESHGLPGRIHIRQAPPRPHKRAHPRHIRYPSLPSLVGEGVWLGGDESRKGNGPGPLGQESIATRHLHASRLENSDSNIAVLSANPQSLLARIGISSQRKKQRARHSDPWPAMTPASNQIHTDCINLFKFTLIYMI